MAVTLTLFVVDSENMREFYSPRYPNKVDFLHAFMDARTAYEDIHAGAIPVISEPSVKDIKQLTFYRFLSRLFEGETVELYAPEKLGETELAMITELAHYCDLTAYNKMRGWPDTDEARLIAWLRENEGKEIAVVFA
jgi:hypothetical protein